LKDIQNNIFHVCLSICLSHLSCPVPPKKSLKQKISVKKVVRYTSRVTKNIQNHAAVLGEETPSYAYAILKPLFRVSLHLQSQSQAFVCVSIPKKYPRHPWAGERLGFEGDVGGQNLLKQP